LAITYTFFFKPSPVPFFSYRNWLLNVFGATVKKDAHVYPTVKIWLPANLTMQEGSALGPNVNVYNQGNVSIGRNVIVSQGAHLCASTHDYNSRLHPLILAPILIEANAWICADAFIGPGVTIAEGGVVGARAVAMKNIEAWGVYGGNPARKINERTWFD